MLNSTNYDSSTGNLVYKFPSPYQAVNKKLALIVGTFYNSFFNVSSALKNNVFKFTFAIFPSNTAPTGPTNTAFTLTLPDGYYTFEQLNFAFQNFFIQNNLYMTSAQGNVYFYSLVVNPSLYAIQLTSFEIPNTSTAAILGWSFLPGTVTGGGYLYNSNPTANMFGPLLTITPEQNYYLGISAGTYPSSTSAGATYNTVLGTKLGESPPQVDLVTNLIVRCNMVTNSAIGNPVDMIAQLPITSSFGAANIATIDFPVFSTVSNATYSELVLSFMSQNKEKIKFLDPSLSFTIYIEDQ